MSPNFMQSHYKILREARQLIRHRASWVSKFGLIRSLSIALSIYVSFMAASASAAEAFREGLSAYNVEDYRSAYSIWLRLAKHGDARSQSSLAYLYYQGHGVRQDRREAAKWYYLAATQGEPTAQSFLCEMHMRGDGVQRDLRLALMWCELSLENGETRGLHLREELMLKMTTKQQNAAWALLARWKRLSRRNMLHADLPMNDAAFR